MREPGFRNSLKSLFRRRFRTVKAVDDISFQIGKGEIVGFLGPNGAGKTTTMKVLSGLLYPSAGKVDVGGFVPFEQKNSFKRRISLVMGQKSQLIWDLPASETFLVNKVIYDIPDNEYKRNLGQMVELLKIGGLLNKPVRQLSLGERMKCELVAALIHKPEIIFLDEPTIGLDVNMQEAVRGFIEQYNREFQATILLTTHYMADVTALCRRVMVINKGKLLYDGGIQQLVDKYAPHKAVRLQLSEKIDPSTLSEIDSASMSAMRSSPRMEVVHYQFPTLELRVPRELVSEVSARLLTHLPVIDLTIEDPSMESVISEAFEGGGGAGESDP